jgi:hypothetical protein
MNINLPLDPRLRPPDGTRQPPPPSHPSEGGKAYSDDLRRQVLQMHFNNYDLREAPELVFFTGRKEIPILSTCVRWIQFFNQTGDICPLRRTGNHMRRGRCKARPSNSWLSIDAFFPRPLLPSAGCIYSMLIP